MTEQTPQEVQNNLEGMRASLSDITQSFRELERVIQKPMDDLGRSTAQNTERLKSLNDQLGSFKDKLERDFGKAITGAIENGSGFLDFFDKMRSSLEDLVIQLAVVNPALNLLFGGQRGTLPDLGGAASAGAASGDNGLLGNLAGSILNLFDARAFGGPVNAGQPYLVGERGPELFVPQAAGRIQSNGGGGGTPVSITMNISTPDAGSFRSSQTQIAAAMLDAARRAQRIR